MNTTTKRLKALHRALPADEAFRRGALWEKVVSACFGLDAVRENIAGREAA